MDGLGGPVILGTGFYIKRSALLGELPGGYYIHSSTSTTSAALYLFHSQIYYIIYCLSSKMNSSFVYAGKDQQGQHQSHRGSFGCISGA